MNDIEIMPLSDDLYQQHKDVQVCLSHTSFQIEDPQWISLPYKLKI
jgi:hypothetical protein